MLKTLGKYAAVVSSVTLLGTYVGYQAGCVHLPFSKETAAPSAEGYATAAPTATPEAAVAPAGAKERMLMLSSKSGPVTAAPVTAGTVTAGTGTGESSKVLIWGSKSGQVQLTPQTVGTAGVPAAVTRPTTQPPVKQEKSLPKKALLSGSKSMIVLTPEQATALIKSAGPQVPTLTISPPPEGPLAQDGIIAPMPSTQPTTRPAGAK